MTQPPPDTPMCLGNLGEREGLRDRKQEAAELGPPASSMVVCTVPVGFGVGVDSMGAWPQLLGAALLFRL